ncbi:MAG: VacJ family lipoprotein [Gammaproteobacteria bacterium]|nr:VacJ family lipoprotein [Gammaproteobacteria bacterium]
MIQPAFLRIGIAALALALLPACATTRTQAADPRDPFEPINRASYAFNDGLDRALLKPAAETYRKVTPGFVQTGISNVFLNAKYPVTLVNDALQGKFRAALNDTGRFMLNTTLGLGGLFDPATDVGLDLNDEDFGQTFGKWGVGAGPYFVVPLFGPTTLRDGLGSVADDFAEPRAYLEDDSTRWTLWVVGKFEKRVRLLDADALLERAGDPYAFVRSAYLQRREYQIRDGADPADNLEQELEKDLEQDAATTAPHSMADGMGETSRLSARSASARHH